MKSLYTFVLAITISASLMANGVIIPDSSGIKYLPMISSTVEVSGGIHGQATISIYDALGRLVAEYIIAVEGNDEYELIWNPAESHPDLAAGLFGYTIHLNGETLKGMMIYQK